MDRELKVFNDTVIYIWGLPNGVSGGPEALHQLVYYLRQLGYTATIVFPEGTIDSGYEIMEDYQKYITDYITSKDIDDNAKNVLIIPEGYGLEYYSKFKKIQKAVWFLGIGCYRAFYDKDFSLIEKGKRILRIAKHRVFSVFDLDYYVKKDKTVNLAASYYAFDYLYKHKGDPKLLIEPISKEFFKFFGREIFASFVKSQPRKNIILYNPARENNEKMASALKSILPDYDFIPLKGFTHNKLIELMLSSKLYIDFGRFPGAERIPKEAVVCGMCIITSKKGAAGFHEDVPIPDKFKFVDYENSIRDIAALIEKIMANYDDVVDEFEEYRQTVYHLEDNFKKQIQKAFRRVVM